jgi:hypothetical protein
MVTIDHSSATVSRDRFDDGIPPWALGPRSSVGHDPVRDFAPDRSQPVRYSDFEYRPQLAVLSVRGNSRRYWAEAGQALEIIDEILVARR